MTINEFSEWLSQELAKRNWKATDLAKSAKLNDGIISRILDREREPTPKTLQAIAKGLRLPVETVYRAAGLLPPIDLDLADLEEFREILKYLTPEEREELKQFGRLKIDLRRQRELRNQATHNKKKP